MGPASICRLCLKSCHELKSLFDDNDQLNGIYEIAVKYFDPKLLQPRKENTSSVICIECWQHIDDFFVFQQTVIDTQSKLEYTKPIVTKVEDELKIDEILSTNRFSDSVSSKSNPIAVFDIIQIRDETQQQSQDSSLSATQDTTGILFAITSQDTVLFATTQGTPQDIVPSAKYDDETNDVEFSSDIDMPISSGKKSTTKESMDDKITKWMGDLKCAICTETFANYTLLNSHFDATHPNQECYVLCCDRKFNKRFKLVRHISRIHIGKDRYPYKCELCGRPFFEHCKLKLHIRRFHHQFYKYDYECELCGESFEQEGNLKKHINRKHKELSLSTTIGHMSPNSSDTRSANNILQWICNDCNRIFDSHSILESHQKKYHSIIKINNKTIKKSVPLLLCNLCRKIFKTPNTYFDHMKIDHIDVTINDDLIADLEKINKKPGERKKEQRIPINDNNACSSMSMISYEILELMSEEEQRTIDQRPLISIDPQNQICMTPLDITDVKHEITIISDDSDIL